MHATLKTEDVKEVAAEVTTVEVVSPKAGDDGASETELIEDVVNDEEEETKEEQN